MGHSSLLPNSLQMSQFLPPPCRLHPASVPTTAALSPPLTTKGHCQDHSSHLGTCPSMYGLLQPQSIMAKFFIYLQSPQRLLGVAFKALSCRLFILISFFPSLSALNPFTESVLILKRRLVRWNCCTLEEKNLHFGIISASNY